MGIRVLKGGMMTTVQDLGRTGYQSQGFSVSGVMDVRSFKIANLLLDNPENEAVLEFTLIGPTLEFTSETIISITGGDFRPQIACHWLLLHQKFHTDTFDISFLLIDFFFHCYNIIHQFFISCRNDFGRSCDHLFT